MRITKSQLRRIMSEVSREAKNHPINDLARKQQGTFGGGMMVDPEGFTYLIQQGIDFSNEKSKSPLQMTESQLRRLIRDMLIEQVVGYKTPAQSQQAAQDPDYLDDGDVSVAADPGTGEDVEASTDAIKQLTQQRQKQLDTGQTVDATETGRELSGLRKRRG